MVAMLAACGNDAGFADIGTLWGAEGSADRAAREELAARRANKVPMQTVRGVEIGRTARGILLTAYGTAPSPGFSLPALRVRRDGKPAGDGYLEFDLVASRPAPDTILPPATPRNLEIRADLPIDIRALRAAPLACACWRWRVRFRWISECRLQDRLARQGRSTYPVGDRDVDKGHCPRPGLGEGCQVMGAGPGHARSTGRPMERRCTTPDR